MTEEEEEGTPPRARRLALVVGDDDRTGARKAVTVQQHVEEEESRRRRLPITINRREAFRVKVVDDDAVILPAKLPSCACFVVYMQVGVDGGKAPFCRQRVTMVDLQRELEL